MKRTVVLKDDSFLKHVIEQGHPESPQRLESIYAMLAEPDMAGLFDVLAPRQATKDELALTHSPAYIERIAATAGRQPVRLDPATDAAKIRAMYTDPGFVRQGVGRRVMELCEGAARAAGFSRTEMMATMAGIPLYEVCGYRPVEEVLSAPIDGVRVPLVRMEKQRQPE